MKNSISVILVLVIFITLGSCAGKSGNNNNDESQTEVSSAPDTGFTGIRQYFSKNFLSYEATFRNGIRNGLMKTYYPSGKLRQTFWYENGLREDTAVWYHEDGVVFRKTPFRRDSMNGIQIQFYKSGKIRAKLEYVDGLRKPYLEEFKEDGKKVTNYPDVVVKTKDEYSLNGTYKIYLELSKPDVKATYWRGDYVDGLFAPKKLVKINNSETTGYLQLVKGTGTGPGYVGIITEVATTMGNKQLVYKKVTIPYNDLK
jgi:antitoxin component YwqK of YwqJK toxin-antitoxin module